MWCVCEEPKWKRQVTSKRTAASQETVVTETENLQPFSLCGVYLQYGTCIFARARV